MPRSFTPLKVAGLLCVNLRDVLVSSTLALVSVTLTVDAVEDENPDVPGEADSDTTATGTYTPLPCRPTDVLVRARCIISDLVATVKFTGPWAAVAGRYLRRQGNESGSVSLGLGGEGASVVRCDNHGWVVSRQVSRPRLRGRLCARILHAGRSLPFSSASMEGSSPCASCETHPAWVD